MAFRPLFKASILICLQILEEADRQHTDDSFWLFYGLWSLNGRNSASYIYYGSVFKGVLVFVITKTKRGICFLNLPLNSTQNSFERIGQKII